MTSATLAGFGSGSIRSRTQRMRTTSEISDLAVFPQNIPRAITPFIACAAFCRLRRHNVARNTCRVPSIVRLRPE
jgi:hypothetical protein